jgi:organic hydroperoxide reductase OsmC/OhrA
VRHPLTQRPAFIGQLDQHAALVLVVADVSLGALPTGGFGLAAQIEVSLPELDRETAEALVAQAHQVCPYSNATRGNMHVTLAVA